MSKTNFLIKYLKNISKFINNLLEKNLNKLNFKNFNYLLKNNKIILTFVALFVIFISYLLLPTFYTKSELSKELKNSLQSKYNINIKFSQNIEYNLLPKPHFTTTQAVIFADKNEISKIKKLKIYISLKNLFSVKKIKIKKINIENANFNFNKKNYNFLINLLDNNFEENTIKIKNSNIFFRDKDGEVLFINKIKSMKYFFDSSEIKNILVSENEIFNIPYSISLYKTENKKLFSKIDIGIINLQIQNEIYNNGEIKKGLTTFNFNQKKSFANYEIQKKIFQLNFSDKYKNPNFSYEIFANLNPFFSSIKGNLNKINIPFLFDPNTIFVQLLKTELLNHKNLNLELNINAKKVDKYKNLANVILNSKIQEGLLDLDTTKFSWKDSADFELSETLLYINNNHLIFDGKLMIEISDSNEIYKFMLTPKKFRKNLKNVELLINYNFDEKLMILNKININNKEIEITNPSLKNIIFKNDKIQNKIYIKNIFNEIVKSYSG